MAIAEDPLKINNLTKIDFTSANKNLEISKSGLGSSKLLDKVVNPANGIIGFGNSLLDKASNFINDLQDKALGLFNSVVCDKLPSMNLRMPKFKESADKSISGITGLNGLNIKKGAPACGLEKLKNPFDSLMKIADFFKKNPGILSGDFETRLNALLKSDLLNKMNIFGLGGLVPTCLLNKAIGSINGNDNFMSGSLASKERLKHLLYQSECGAMLANVPFVSKLLSQGSGNAILDILLNGDPTRASTYINMAMQAVGMRQNVLGELVHSILFAYDYNMYKKLQLANSIYSNLTPEDKSIMGGNNVSNIFEGLDKDVKDKNIAFKDPAKELEMIDKVLGLIGGNWNKDENGNFNYSVAEKSDVYKDLSKDYLLKNVVKDLNLTGNYTTTLTSAHRVSIPLVFTTRVTDKIDLK